MASFFLLRPSFFHTTSTVGKLLSNGLLSTRIRLNRQHTGETSKTIRQRNRSWIKGLGKNPQKNELIHWRPCLLSGPPNHVPSDSEKHLYTRVYTSSRTMSWPRVACWHGPSAKLAKNRMRVKTSADRRLNKKIAGLNGIRCELVKLV